MPADSTAVVAECARFYLESYDFNGIPVGELAKRVGSGQADVIDALRELIGSETVGIQTPECANSHILRFGFPDIDAQVKSLDAPDEHHTCVYVRPPHLNQFVPDTLHANAPYKRQLALGDPQLSFLAFDLAVLEHYRNDPRYEYNNYDLSGDICIRDEFFDAESVAEGDKILLKTFGICFDEDMNRAVAVFLRYLADLSPEHQRIWEARQLRGEFKLHPDYFDSQIMASWDTGVSACDAILGEMRIINEMAVAMGREPLFRDDFGEHGERKPVGFAFLLRPTNHEYQAFASVLDRMLSDNLNRAFFRADIAFEKEVPQGDGRFKIEQKGTITILDEWLRAKCQVDDWADWEAAIAALREVRKLRQGPAHKLDDNHFDQKYFADQRELLERVYRGMRSIRLLFANHPAVRRAEIGIDDYLVTGKKIRFQ